MLNENQIILVDVIMIRNLVNKQIVNCSYCKWSGKFENLRPHLETHLEC